MRSVSDAPALAAYFDCVRQGGGVAISAHRAQSADDQAENSIAAIEATGRAIPGAILEIDAVLTRDGRLVLMHDETLDRTTTGHGRVADRTLAEVKAARLRAPDGTLTAAAPPTRSGFAFGISAYTIWGRTRCAASAPPTASS